MAGMIDSLFSGVPTDEDVARWRVDLRAIREAIAALHQKEATLERLIAAYSGDDVPQAVTTLVRRKRGEGEATWIGQVKAIAQKNPEGISYDDVRAALPEPFASCIEGDATHKSFYGAMRRLERRKFVVRHNNHLFTPDGFKKYKADVEAGRRKPVPGFDRRSSPMQEALKEYLASHPRSKPAEIKIALCAFPDLKPGLTRNSATIYNVLGKLTLREELVRHEDSTYSLANENGAPRGNSAGAPTAGEVDASPTDNQPTLRLIG